MLFRFFLLVMHFTWTVDTASDTTLCRCDEKSTFGGKPFVALWNSPTIGCDFNFSTPIHLRKYGILENERQTWDGKQVTVFASAQLGLYPYYVLDGGGNYNGGLPQLVDLNQHLRKARLDILNKIPDPNFNGVAVIDWEPWRPLWETNWNKKRIYKVRSVELVRNKHPDWPLDKLINQAKGEFEESGRAMFEQTITLGKQLRPKALWGFYGFPDCFAHVENRYQCTPEVRGQNDKLEWLFSSSTALFPSMYLLDQHPDNRDYVLGRLRETLRFATRGVGKNRRKLPIFVYHRNIYENSPHEYNFLTKEDLDNTVGAAAGIGASGIVIWGNRFDENTSPEVCRRIDHYIANHFGPYLQNKVQEVEQCRSNHCKNKGHCMKKILLNAALSKVYEQEELQDQCMGKASSLPTLKTTNSQKETKLPSNTLYKNSVTHRYISPHANTTSHVKTTAHANTLHINDKASHFNKLHVNASEPIPQGYSIDLGSQLAQGHYVDHSAMEDFFQLLNGTNKPSGRIGSTKRPKQALEHHEVPSHQVPHAEEDSSKHFTHISSTKQSSQKDTIKGNSTHGKSKELHKKHQVHHEENMKKSVIPLPLSRKQPASNIVMDQTQSEIVHRLLASVQGTLVSSSQFLKKKNHSSSKKAQSSRKSQILKSPASHLPLMSSAKKSRKTWLPHMYVILIGVSMGGALMFSLIFVAVYYYISLRNTFPTKRKKKDAFYHEEDKGMPPKAHSSPKGSENNTSSKESSIDSDNERKRYRREKKKTSDNAEDSSDNSREKRVNRRVRSADRHHQRYDSEERRQSRSHSQTSERHHRGRSCDNRKSSNGYNKEQRKHGSQERKTDLRRTKSRKENYRRSKTSDEDDEIEINVNDLK